jgi:NADPH:quinone reductase-like Zn-dependent oxidoreductase
METRAVLIESFEDTPHLAPRALPEPKEDEVVIRVHASSINAFDWKAAEGRFKEMFEYAFPVTIGRDYAGVVERVGGGVDGVAPGEAVFGYFTGQTLGQGAFAERIVVPQSDCFVRKPDGLSFVDAACLPLCGMVAYRLVDAVDPKEGERHLVLGAPGGVGSYAVQLLRQRGAYVLATGLADDAAYLRELGADEVVDYRSGIALAEPLDGLLDLVQYKNDFTAFVREHLRPGSRAASLHRSADPELLEPLGVTGTNVHSGPDAALLERIGADAAAGRLRVPLQRTFALADAPTALDLHKNAHARGKFALELDHSG